MEDRGWQNSGSAILHLRSSILAFAFHLRASALICGFILLLTGCIPKRGPEVRVKPYYGETLPMAEVVARINANNSRIPTLWANVREMEVDFVDDDKKRHHEILGGVLNYRAPRDVSLVGTKDLAGKIVQLGSNLDTYWLTAYSPGPDTAWWGRYKFLGSECAQPIPMRPDLVLEVLGLSTVNPDFNQVPVPVMRFNHGADAYMFIWNERAQTADRWVARKEVWYDRATLRPKMIVLFDLNGRVTLEAHLGSHVPVDVPGTTTDQRPTVASEFQLFFPESGSKLRLKLSDPKLSRNGVPNDKTFRFDPTPKGAGVAKVIQLDEACGP